jgi:hypothetical protein
MAYVVKLSLMNHPCICHPNSEIFSMCKALPIILLIVPPDNLFPVYQLSSLVVYRVPFPSYLLCLPLHLSMLWWATPCAFFSFLANASTAGLKDVSHFYSKYKPNIHRPKVSWVCFQYWDYSLSSGRITDDQWTEKDLEGSGCGITEALSCLPLIGFSLGLLFNPEYIGNVFLKNVTCFHQVSQSYIPEALPSHHCQNLKSNTVTYLVTSIQGLELSVWHLGDHTRVGLENFLNHRWSIIQSKTRF